jgi:hypothetical protein
MDGVFYCSVLCDAKVKGGLMAIDVDGSGTLAKLMVKLFNQV